VYLYCASSGLVRLEKPKKGNSREAEEWRSKEAKKQKSKKCPKRKNIPKSIALHIYIYMCVYYRFTYILNNYNIYIYIHTHICLYVRVYYIYIIDSLHSRPIACPGFLYLWDFCDWPNYHTVILELPFSTFNLDHFWAAFLLQTISQKYCSIPVLLATFHTSLFLIVFCRSCQWLHGCLRQSHSSYIIIWTW